MEHSCPVCDSAEITSLLKVNDVPLQDGRLWATAEESARSPVGTIDLRLCNRCSHAWNSSFQLSRLTFDGEYDISLWHSPTYKAFIDQVIAGLIERFSLRQKQIFELGCGKGEFLRDICLAGNNVGTGFDPTYRPNPSLPQSIKINPRLFTAEDAAFQQADFAVARSVLQYSTRPIDFIGLLSAGLNSAGLNNANVSGAYVEVPNGSSTFGESIVWNLCYEHANLYSPYSLTYLLQKSGFEDVEVVACFNGQNLGGRGIWNGGTTAHPPTPSSLHQTPGYGSYVQSVLHFAESFRQKVEERREQLERWQTVGKRIALWGAGARAVGYCTLLGLRADIDSIAVVDINPNRQGRYLPVTGHQVTSPESLRQYSPDVVIATNPTFAAEIRQQFDQLELDADFQVL